jgi:hypothetical protein
MSISDAPKFLRRRSGDVALAIESMDMAIAVDPVLREAFGPPMALFTANQLPLLHGVPA